MSKHLRLGVNIDHVATIRNARGGFHPDPLRAALLAEEAGANGITVHLREDRRHIQDDDLTRLKEHCKLPINLEIAATEEMISIASRLRPHAVCIVPEKREERTTEGGLEVAQHQALLKPFVQRLRGNGIRVSLFINPVDHQINAAKEIGADIVELHTGSYCDAPTKNKREFELGTIKKASVLAHHSGLECHAGHGLTFDTVSDIAAIDEIIELNIGHFLIGEAVFTGLKEAIITMKTLMQKARS